MAKTPNIFSLSSSLVLLIMAAAAISAATSANGQSPFPAPVAAPGVSPMAVPSPGPSSSPLDACIPYLFNLTDCLTYVQQGSNLTKPEKPCCPEVKNLINTQPICLCELLAHPEQSPLPVDLPRALELPSVCKIDTGFGSPASGCALLGVPIAAPALSPAGGISAAPEPSSGGTTLSPEGLPSSPASTPSNGQRIGGSSNQFLLGLAIVGFASFFYS